MADELTQWSVAAETKEFVGPITVSADGAPVTNFDVTLTLGAARPTAWVAATVLDGSRGIMVGADTPFPLVARGKYTVWVRFTDSPEAPVLSVGNVRIY